MRTFYLQRNDGQFPNCPRKRVNVRLIKILKLRKFFTDYFEIHRLCCIRILACLYIPTSPPGTLLKFFPTPHHVVIILLEIPLTAHSYYSPSVPRLPPLCQPQSNFSQIFCQSLLFILLFLCFLVHVFSFFNIQKFYMFLL